MRIQNYLLSFTCILLACATAGQTPLKIVLKNYSIIPAPLSQKQLDSQLSQSKKIAGRRMALLQFDNIPTPAERSQLENAGIRLLDYIPANTYAVSLSSNVTLSVLKRFHARAILAIDPAMKLSASLSFKSNKEQDLLVAFFVSIPIDTIRRALDREGIRIIGEEEIHFNILTVRVPAGKLRRLAELPFISSVEPMPPAPVALNFESRNDSRANILQSGLPAGYNLRGKGITVGISEAATSSPSGHIDFFDRNVTKYMASSGGAGDYHATHVFGIMGGAGIINEKYTGYAPEATIIGSGSSFFSSAASSYEKLLSLMRDSGMVITSNSYAVGVQCAVLDNSVNYVFDKLAIEFPNLLNVYASGNSGQLVCTDYPIGFNSVHNGGNSSKNTISVGNTLSDGSLAPSSSKGPGYGGRIKPDIMALGTSVISTIQNNSYGTGTGTSMSAPAVAGGLALLNQRYRELHQGRIPEGDILKAVLCNTATDLGNPGPDFSNGFGWMNLLRAVRSLDNNWQLIDSVSNNSTKTHTITVPAGAAQVKLLLYWHDPPASPLAGRPLVNDLDITVRSASGTEYLPFILDTIHANVNAVAVTGVDHINNVEQVLINLPAAGEYTISIKGTEIGQSNKQRYVVSYDIVMPELETTFPHGGEGLTPNESIVVQWEDGMINPGPYALDFSIDNGSNWQTINAAIPGSKRQFPWTLPAITTKDARIRVRRVDGSGVSASSAFTIVGQPLISLSPNQCPGYINFNWTPVAGASDYEIFLKKNGQMDAVGITTATNYKLVGLSPDSTYWFSVRARINGSAGRRGLAISRKPDNGNCAGDVSDGDLQLEELLSPISGRHFTVSQPTAAEKIRIRIRNIDDQPINGFTARYKLNNGGWISETSTTIVPALSSYDFEFATTIDASLPGIYNMKLAIETGGDLNASNDSLTRNIRHINNPVLNLATPFIDSFTTVPAFIYYKSQTGIETTDPYDYINESPNAFLYYTPNTVGNIARQGMKMRIIGAVTNADHHQLIGTFNLSGYDTATADIGFRFMYSKFSPSINNKVFIRGNELLPWIPAYSLPLLPASQGDVYSILINLGKLLRNAGQNYSSSFQVSFDHRNTLEEFVFSEIDLADMTHDVQVVSIDSIKAANFELGNQVPIRVKCINNGKFVVNNLHISYKLDQNAAVDEVIPTMLPGDTMYYVFNQKADISDFGLHNLEAWVSPPGDLFPINDRKSLLFRNIAVVRQFPYLEDFEHGDGGFYAEGVNSSWAYGNAVTGKINSAASGNSTWKTGLTGTYKSNESSFLYSPAFNLTGLSRPMISMSIAMNFDNCYTFFCDGFATTYTTDNVIWRPFVGAALGSYNWPTNWDMRNTYQWRVHTNVLPAAPFIRFRFNMRSNAELNLDGISIDDIHIYDSTAMIYQLPLNPTTVVKPVNAGNNWVEFRTGDKIIAAINSNGQDLGMCSVQLKQGSGSANYMGQYYLARHFMLNAEKPAQDSIGLRLFFKNAEIDSMLAARSCPACTLSPDGYRLGISSFLPDPNETVREVIGDNIRGKWNYITSSSLQIVPFMDGYYAEFQVKDLAAYWFNDGGLDKQSILPLTFNSFELSRIDVTSGRLNWATKSEINVARFEIEVAKGNEAFEAGQFTKIGEKQSLGRSLQPQSYSFDDADPGKAGAYYYRVKAVDEFGNYSYSKTLPLLWSNELVWQAYPNPSRTGIFNLRFQADPEERVLLRIFDATGKQVKEQMIKGNGLVQTSILDLGKAAPAGLYLLEIRQGAKKFSLKLLKD